MNHVDIEVAVEDVVDFTKMIIEALGGIAIIDGVRLNTKKTIREEDNPNSKWNLVFECVDPQGKQFEIRVANLMSGSKDPSTKAMVKLLKYANFLFWKYEIYSQEFEDETWYKD